VIGICTTRINIWETLMPFKRRVWRLPKSKAHLCHVNGSTARSTFFRDDACWWWVGDLSPVEIFFLSLPYKIIDLSTFLLVFQLQFLFFRFLIFLLCFFVKVLFIFNFILQSQFDISYFFQFDPYSFDF